MATIEIPNLRRYKVSDVCKQKLLPKNAYDRALMPKYVLSILNVNNLESRRKDSCYKMNIQRRVLSLLKTDKI